MSNADLDAAIAGTAMNVDGFFELSLSVADPPTQAEVQSIADKLDELINALKRV